MTITLHIASVWTFLGKLAVTALAAYLLLAFVMLMTMDSGWWVWPWFIGGGLLTAVVYGVWFA